MDEEINDKSDHQFPGALPFIDYYKVLNIEKNASGSQIRNAFFNLKNTYNGSNQALYSLIGNQEINETLEQVDKAFNTLSSIDKRIEYDRTLVEKNLAQTDELFPYIQDILTNEEKLSNYCDKNAIREDIPTHGELSNFDEVDTFSTNKDMAITEAFDFQTIPDSMESPYTQTKGKLALFAKNAQKESVQTKITTLLEETETVDGELLRKIRDIVGVDMEEMQEHTKISRGTLEAIEKNFFDRLPQVVYVKGFLKSYLKFLGIENDSRLLNEYIESFNHWQNKNAL